MLQIWVPLVVFFTDRAWWTRVNEKKDGKGERERERERAGSLSLCGKQIKPMYRTCTIHEGTGHLLKEVLKARVRK